MPSIQSLEAFSVLLTRYSYIFAKKFEMATCLSLGPLAMTKGAKSNSVDMFYGYPGVIPRAGVSLMVTFMLRVATSVLEDKYVDREKVKKEDTMK